MEYGKIDTLFERDERFVVDPTQLKNPVFSLIKSWEVTEKIDGTNMRLTLLEGASKFEIGGRTDRASIPGDLHKTMENLTTPEQLHAHMDGYGAGWEKVVLYGEGYGAGIQKGSYYRSDKSFRMFDILVADKHWLNWRTVQEVGGKLGIKTVPYLGSWTLEEIVERVRQGILSITAQEENGVEVIAEGVVARPAETLFQANGKRLILKLKTKDFIGGR